MNLAEKAWSGKPVAGSTADSDWKRRKLIDAQNQHVLSRLSFKTH